jgi:8-oxo-dGTP diphosphatase
MRSEEYLRPLVTVDVVIFTLREGDLQVLLIRRKNPPYAGMWAIPGGFIEIEEPLEAAALRELEEETGVRNVHLEQLYTFGDPGRDPRGRVITVAYMALLPAEQASLRAGDDAADARWWSMSALPPLAFDHDRILACARERLRSKLEHPASIAALLPETFTLRQLRTAYEAILGEKLEEDRFRYQTLAAGVLQEAGTQHRTGRGRPSKLYRFRQDAEAMARRIFL